METRTIKQVVAELPYLKTTTIFTYIQRGLFRPVAYFPPPNGPGRSSKLNKADIAVLCVLSNLHNLGVRFGHLDTPGGETMPDTRFIIQNGITENLTLADIGYGRRLQLELETTGFKSMIAVHRSRVVGFNAGRVMVGEATDTKTSMGLLTEVYMFTDKHLPWHIEAITAVEPYDTLSFVNMKKIINSVDRVTK